MDINEINRDVVFTDLDIYVLSIFNDFYHKGEKEVQAEYLLEVLHENCVSYVPCGLNKKRLQEIVSKLGTTLAQKDIVINEKVYSRTCQVTLPVSQIAVKDETGYMEKLEFQIVGAPVSISDKGWLEAMDRGDLV